MFEALFAAFYISHGHHSEHVQLYILTDKHLAYIYMEQADVVGVTDEY